MYKISAKNLNYCYGENDLGTKALREVSLEIEEGEFLCIVGHSGCGKTTLLRLLAGLLRPTSGELCIDGKLVNGTGPDRTMVFQQYSLFPWMTSFRNIFFAIRQTRPTLPKKTAASLAHRYLELVGMADAAGKYPYQLSGGMRQRVAIARALAADADILLLDEPFGAVDAKSRTELQQLLLRLWTEGEKKKTIVFVTHDLDEALLLSDRILFMRCGCISGNVRIPFERPRIKAELERTPAYERIRKLILDMFYREEEQETEESEGERQ